MKIQINAKDLDTFQHQLGEFNHALKDINAQIANIKIQSGDTLSLEQALGSINSIIDRESERFIDNPLVEKVSVELKEKIRQALVHKFGAAGGA